MTLPLLAVAVSLTVAAATASADSNWPRWRGPLQDGHSTESGFPKEWSAKDVSWKASLPGDGQSSPVIWGEKIFLTAAIDGGSERVALCVDRTNGQIVWQKSLWKGSPEPTHKMNGHASATCTTDGQRVYAFFGFGGGLFCLSVNGDLLWNKPLGNFDGPWGTAACPVLVDDLVIQNCDSDGDAFMVAFDKVSGDLVWKIPREKNRCWSTPILINSGDRRELVLQGHTGVRSYDPTTGEEFWQVNGSSGRGTPTVTLGNDLLYVVPGRPGETYALRAGGKGDVTATHKAWSVKRKGRDLGSPIVIGEYMLLMGLNGGILTCYNAKTGKELWQERIGGNFSASPVAFDGNAAFISEAGEALIVEPADELKIVARNTVGSSDEEIFRASITPSGGQLFIRSNNTLYCVGR
jgi:outer membrane protein assembly factor BamB